MNVLIMGKDYSLFESSKQTAGDSRLRHIEYTKELRKRYPESTIKLICYTPYKKKYKIDKVDEGLTLYPTNSIHRIFFIIDVLFLFFKVTRNWKPNLITTQTPYEEGFIGYLLSRIVKANFLPQLHFDMFSKDWRKENILNHWRKLVASWVIKRSEGIRVVSEVLKNKVISNLGVKESKIFVTPVYVNFINTYTGDKSKKKKYVKSNDC